MEEVGFLGQREFRLRGGRGGGFADGHPLAGPATDGEAFKDVVVVGGASLAARLARGTVLRWGGRTVNYMATGWEVYWGLG